MAAPTPPPATTFSTFCAKVAEPRWQRTTAPFHAPTALQRPPSSKGPSTLVRADPAIFSPNQIRSPALNRVTRNGVVDTTPTPGAANSTSALRCEKPAALPEASTAATDTTDA